MIGRLRNPPVDVERLRAMWADPAYTRAEIARELRLTLGQLQGAVNRAGLPVRPMVRRTGSMLDLSEAEIWRRAAEVKARTLEGMRRESPSATEKRLARERR